MQISVLTLCVAIGVCLIATWLLTKPLGIKKRLLIAGVHIFAFLTIAIANTYDSWVWFYNMQQARQFVSRIATERNWLSSNPEARDEIIGLVFARAQYLGEPAANVDLALKKLEQLEQQSGSRP